MEQAVEYSSEQAVRPSSEHEAVSAAEQGGEVGTAVGHEVFLALEQEGEVHSASDQAVPKFPLGYPPDSRCRS